jgi:hypothetical protein
MIAAIPALRRFWPDSVFIFAKRRAIENVLSRVRKFPAHTFEHHCADWAKNMAAWRKVREQLPPEVFMEVDQQAMIQKPESTARALSAFLSLDAAREPDLVRTFQTNRPQQTFDGSAARVATLEQTEWTDAQISLFLRHCKTEMDAFGYSTDEEYGQL